MSVKVPFKSISAVPPDGASRCRGAYPVEGGPAECISAHLQMGPAFPCTIDMWKRQILVDEFGLDLFWVI